MNTIAKYAICALIAIFFNILFQEISIRIYNGLYPIVVSILTGTLIGLFIKFLLDKIYIFNYHVNGFYKNTKTIAVYISTGIFTTLIFWALEISFEYYFRTKEMRYLGAIIGLIIGYIIKYQLDNKYTFKKRT